MGLDAKIYTAGKRTGIKETGAGRELYTEFKGYGFCEVTTPDPWDEGKLRKCWGLHAEIRNWWEASKPHRRGGDDGAVRALLPADVLATIIEKFERGEIKEDIESKTERVLELLRTAARCAAQGRKVYYWASW